MSHIFVTKHGNVIGIKQGRFIITQKDGVERSIPRETVESITIFGNSNMTTPCIQFCLTKGIPVSFFSGKGHYFGRLESTSHNKSDVTALQIKRFEDKNFAADLCRKIVSAKIRNQEVIIRRYIREMTNELERSLSLMKRYRQLAETNTNLETIMGYEGIAARIYFSCLSEIIEPEFAFKGRSRRPPKDPFNSLLSLGYTLLLHEIYPKLENEGLSPYYAILHKGYANHPALASDMMEEWRSVIVDSTALSMIQGHELHGEHFYEDEETGAVLLTREGMNKFLKKYEKTMNRNCGYLAYDTNTRTMRKALQEQCYRMRLSVMNDNSVEYTPVIIR